MRFALLSVTSSQRDSHPQVCAHAWAQAAALLDTFDDQAVNAITHGATCIRRLLTDYSLSRDRHGEVRTLYSLRHTYATAELLAGTDIHTLVRQMGTTVVMLREHCSK